MSNYNAVMCEDKIAAMTEAHDPTGPQVNVLSGFCEMIGSSDHSAINEMRVVIVEVSHANRFNAALYDHARSTY